MPKQPPITAEEHLRRVKRQSVNGAASYFLRTFFLQGIGLASAIILSAFLAPEEFGIYGFVIQIIGLLTFFSDIGLSARLIQQKNEPSLVEYRTAFTLQQLLSWLIMAIVGVVIVSGLVTSKVGMVGNYILLVLGLSFPLATFKTISSIMLERELQFSKLVVPQILEQLVFHGLLIYLAWNGMGATAYVYAIAARSVIGTVSMLYLAPWSMGLSMDRAALSNLVKYGAKFQLNDFLARIKDSLFFLVIGWFLPLKEFGYISWAKNWSMYPYNLTVQNVMAVTFPTFSRLQGHEHALKRAVEKSLFFISLAIFPILVGMSVFIFPLVHLVSRYGKWEPAAWSFILFALSIGWGAVSSPLTNTLNAIGHINTTLKLMIMWTALTWLVTPLLVLWFGYNGVGISAFLISWSSVLSVYFVKKVVPIDFWSQVKDPFWAATAMAIVGASGISWWQQSWPMMFVGMTLCALTYGLVMFGLARNKVWQEVQSLLHL
jgi:PST family polysaccharide transporter